MYLRVPAPSQSIQIRKNGERITWPLDLVGTLN